MGILDKIKSLLPKRKEPKLINTAPKEKDNIRKTFSKYCNSNHDTDGGKLCAKCTAVLSVVMTKISRCPYGIGKPICEKCETPCFGERYTNDFISIMKSARKKMFLSHPVMTFKHKLAGIGADYAKMQRDKKSSDKQKEEAAKLKAKFANATRSPKKSKKRKK